jgi:hypothetical protein
MDELQVDLTGNQTELLEMEIQSADIEQGVRTAATLEAFSQIPQSQLADFPEARAALNLAVENLLLSIGEVRPSGSYPAMEDAESSGGFVDTIKKIGKAILDAIAAMLRKVVDFFKKILGLNKSVEDRAKKIDEAVADIVKEFSAEQIRLAEEEARAEQSAAGIFEGTSFVEHRSVKSLKPKLDQMRKRPKSSITFRKPRDVEDATVVSETHGSEDQLAGAAVHDPRLAEYLAFYSKTHSADDLIHNSRATFGKFTRLVAECVSKLDLDLFMSEGGSSELTHTYAKKSLEESAKKASELIRSSLQGDLTLKHTQTDSRSELLIQMGFYGDVTLTIDSEALTSTVTHTPANDRSPNYKDAELVKPFPFEKTAASTAELIKDDREQAAELQKLLDNLKDKSKEAEARFNKLEAEVSNASEDPEALQSAKRKMMGARFQNNLNASLSLLVSHVQHARLQHNAMMLAWLRKSVQVTLHNLKKKQ